MRILGYHWKWVDIGHWNWDIDISICKIGILGYWVCWNWDTGILGYQFIKKGCRWVDNGFSKLGYWDIIPHLSGLWYWDHPKANKLDLPALFSDINNLPLSNPYTQTSCRQLSWDSNYLNRFLRDRSLITTWEGVGKLAGGHNFLGYSCRGGHFF